MAKEYSTTNGSTALTWEISASGTHPYLYAQGEEREINIYFVKNLKKYKKKEFKLILNELEWLDEMTRQEALLKLDKMTSFIGYEEEVLNDETLDEFYKGLELNSDYFIENVLELNKFWTEYETSKLRETIGKYNWKTHNQKVIPVDEVSTYYNTDSNSIIIPLHKLDGMDFQNDRPIYMNYGAIGMFLGHTMTRGFDDKGAQIHSEGNLVDWWKKETKEKFNKKVKCMIDQYNNYGGKQ